MTVGELVSALLAMPKDAKVTASWIGEEETFSVDSVHYLTADEVTDGEQAHLILNRP